MTADPGERPVDDPTRGPAREPLDAAEQDPAPVPDEGSSGYSSSPTAYEGDAPEQVARPSPSDGA